MGSDQVVPSLGEDTGLRYGRADRHPIAKACECRSAAEASDGASQSEHCATGHVECGTWLEEAGDIHTALRDVPHSDNALHTGSTLLARVWQGRRELNDHTEHIDAGLGSYLSQRRDGHKVPTMDRQARGHRRRCLTDGSLRTERHSEGEPSAIEPRSRAYLRLLEWDVNH